MFLLVHGAKARKKKKDLAKRGIYGHMCVHLQNSTPIAFYVQAFYEKSYEVFRTYSLGHRILTNHQRLLTETKLFV